MFCAELKIQIIHYPSLISKQYKKINELYMRGYKIIFLQVDIWVEQRIISKNLIF